MNGSLAGLRVLDITISVAGPFATQILGDLGADVIKVERPPGGDDTRQWGPPFSHGESTTFQGLNRNKRSVVADLKTDQGRDTLNRLLETADVLVQNLRPGTLDRLGFGYEAVKQRNPRLIYSEISGFGPGGPLSTQPAYDPLMQAFTGLMSLTGEAGGPPSRIPPSILDQGSAMWAVIGILDALRRRDLGGEGALVQTSLLQTALMWLPGQFVGYFADGVVPQRLGSATPGIAPYQALSVADGWIVVAAGNDGLWRRLCDAMDRADLLADERFTDNPSRVRNREALAKELERTLREQTSKHWIGRLSAASVPVSPIQSLDVVARHEHVAAIGAFTDVPCADGGNLRLVNLPVQVNGDYYPVRLAPPHLGEGGAQVPGRDPWGGTLTVGPTTGRSAGGFSYPNVTVIDESMREGFQIESPAIPVTEKLRLLRLLSQTGLKRIVVGSFVSPKWTPQMAGIDELVDGLEPAAGVIYTALALNERGRERVRNHIPPLSPDDAIPQTLAHLCDVFVRRNTGRSQEAEIAEWPTVIAQAVRRGAAEAGIGVNAAWGSNWLGDFSMAQRMDLLERQHALWSAHGIPVTKVFLGDPMGWNMPDQVEQQLREIHRVWPEITTFHLHLHNTRGTAPISTYTALRTLRQQDMLILDAAVGGMGGCPYCGNGRAAGLVPTEDLIYLLEELGIGTGVDLDKLIEAAVLAEQIVGHQLYGHVSKAGPRPRGERLYPMGMPFVETLEQAQHFRLGPQAYRDGISPWREPITSPTRPADPVRAAGRTPGSEPVT